MCLVLICSLFVITIQGDSIGLLLASFCRRNSSFLLVRLFQSMTSTGNNEFDCPPFSMTDLIYCINSHSIRHPVSIIHECTSSCKFVPATVTSTWNMSRYVQLDSPTDMISQCILCQSLVYVVQCSYITLKTVLC